MRTKTKGKELSEKFSKRESRRKRACEITAKSYKSNMGHLV